MDDLSDLVSVYEAASLTEAHLVKNLLLAQGIEATVSEEDVPLAGLPITPSHVLVLRKDLPQAAAIVNEYNDQQVEHHERPDWTCPACGETVEGAFDECYQCGAARPQGEQA